MQLLTKPEEVMLVKFHEPKGDRIGARPGDFLPTQVFNARETETEGVDFEGAMESLLAHHLIERDEERDGYVLTQQGYDYMYTREGGRRITEE